MNNNTCSLSDSAFMPIRRKIIEWEWYTDVPVKTLFFHLLLKANFVEGNYRGNVIKRGQTLTSFEKMATETGLSLQQTRTAICKLKATCEITCEATRKGHRITINNYETYNDNGPGANMRSNMRSNKKATCSLENSNKKSTTIREEGKESLRKEGEKKGPFFYPPESDEYKLAVHLFDAMKSHNDKHKAPKDNFQKWAKVMGLLKNDGNESSQIAKVIDWIHTPDNFWRSNILSPSKLREKYPQLWEDAGKPKADHLKRSDKGYAMPDLAD
ncbi:MAG: hypothetical protein GY782_01420 [Gammaproteobacteria bacterium]|nr:hypothetical protein [Gammaproteobacteria bacterium]